MERAWDTIRYICREALVNYSKQRDVRDGAAVSFWCLVSAHKIFKSSPNESGPRPTQQKAQTATICGCLWETGCCISFSVTKRWLGCNNTELWLREKQNKNMMAAVESICWLSESIWEEDNIHITVLTSGESWKRYMFCLLKIYLVNQWRFFF